MHDRKLMSWDEQDEAPAVDSGDFSPMSVAPDATAISDGDIQTVIALCTSFFSTFNSVVHAIRVQRAAEPPMRMSA